MDFIRKLKTRHLLKDFTKTQDNFQNKSIYCGFDPTAPSLHLGHLSTINSLVIASSLNYTPIAIIGTATALIGDPSGKSESRPIIEEQTVLKNSISLSSQISKIMKNLQGKFQSLCPEVKILENHVFYEKLGLVQFLREYGYHFPMNPLINRDFVVDRKDGVSFTEFSYGLLQAYDFFQLFDKHSCIGQIGGSDQWSNITAGTELIRKKTGKQAFGCTLPLLVSKDGKKFGKTEGNALFLDESLTKPYDIYQYCLNQPDDLIEQLLFRLTFVPEEEIKELLRSLPEHRLGPKRLAFEIISTIHSPEVAKNTQRISEILFNESYSQLKRDDLSSLSNFAKKIEISEEDKKSPIISILKQKNITSSNKESRAFFMSNSVKINGKPIPEDYFLSDWVSNYFNILTVGKKNIYLLIKES